MTMLEKDAAMTKINKFNDKAILTPTRKSSSAPSTPVRKSIKAPSTPISSKPCMTFDSMTNQEKGEIDSTIMKVRLNL